MEGNGVSVGVLCKPLLEKDKIDMSDRGFEFLSFFPSLFLNCLVLSCLSLPCRSRVQAPEEAYSIDIQNML